MGRLPRKAKKKLIGTKRYRTSLVAMLLYKAKIDDTFLKPIIDIVSGKGKTFLLSFLTNNYHNVKH